MNEFNNRIIAQRSILGIVNSKSWGEELYGLSSDAIKRWCNCNNISSNNEISRLLYNISDKLFFLANKSQEQITEDYKAISLQIENLSRKLSITMSNI